MRRFIRGCGLALVAAASPICSTRADSKVPDDFDSVIVADRIRAAFYEHAPNTLSAAMSKAVRSWCSSADRERTADSNKANAETVGWLCAKHKLRYFRSIYVNGEKGSHGLVCEDNGTSSLKYFGTDLVVSVIEDGECVPAEFDGTVYQLQFESVNIGSDTLQRE